MIAKLRFTLSVSLAVVAVLLCSVSSYVTETECEAVEHAGASAVSETASVFRVSVDSDSHSNYGLSYPVTYEFSIPSALSVAKAYKSSSGVWVELPVKTSSDFFNGIETVRFDFDNHRAYVSASFPADEDFFDVMVTDNGGEPQDITFVEICQYYDDRKAVVTSTADDWNGNTEFESAFDNWCDAWATRQMWTTVGVCCYEDLVPTWSRIQAKIDNGFVEIANHTRTHPAVPYEDWEDELSTFRDEMTCNLDLPSIQKKGIQEYITAFIEPYGSWSETLADCLGQYGYLSDRSYAGGGTTFTSWNSSYGTYGRALFTVEVGSMGTEDLESLNGGFDVVYAGGGVYHLMSHPYSISDWTPSGCLCQHLDHIKNKTDVWYVPFGALYMYHYCQEVNYPGQPHKPINVSPPNGATEVSLTPTLESSAFANPCPTATTHTASQWQIRMSSGDYSSPMFDSQEDSTNLLSISVPEGELDYSTTYWWRVRHQNNLGVWSEWSNETFFATVNRAPNQPSNVWPANGATEVSLTPTLESSAFSDPDDGDNLAASQWQITSSGGDYSSPVFDSSSALVPSGVLEYSTTYYWRVRQQDNHGAWSPWSVETSFMTVDLQPDRPSNLSPASGSTGVSVTPMLESSIFLSHGAGQTHAASQWQITAISGNYSNTVFDSGHDELNLVQISLWPGILNGHTTYYWRVRHQSNHGLWSEWSAETSFTTANRQPDQPGNTSPSDGATGVSVTPMLQSSAFSDPDYGDAHAASQWQITTISGNYATPVFDSGSDNSNLVELILTSGILNGHTTYFWRVRYLDNDAAWSEWSAETSFTTANRQPDQPGSTSPSNGATGVSVTPMLQSSAFSDPDYGDAHAASQWQITRMLGDYSSPVFDSGVDAVHLTEINIASGVLSSHSYYWRVRYEDNHLSWSEWSAEALFTAVDRLPDQPLNLSPASGAVDVSRKCVLRSSAFADPDSGDTHTASQWQVSSYAGDYSSPVFDSIVDSGDMTDIAIPLGVLQYSTAYHWRVRHQDSHSGWSEWSLETSFTTSSQPYAEFSVTSVRVSEGVVFVRFSSLASGGASPLTYAWDFDNDGIVDAVEKEPWHPYSAPGTYTVSLSVTDAWGETDTEVKPNCLTVLAPEGAKVETADGRISAELPRGAVTGTAVVSIKTTSSSFLADMPKGFKAGGTCFIMIALDGDGNEVVTLSGPSIITVRYSEADVAAADGDPSRLVLAFWDAGAGKWKTLGTAVDTSNMTLSASTERTGTLAVLAKTTPAPNGLPIWFWIVIGLACIPAVGVGVFGLARRQVRH
jgi:PKD repeat protein